MLFPYFLGTEEMAFYVLDNFDSHLMGAAFPPLPISDDYQDLCLAFVLSNTEEVTITLSFLKYLGSTFM